NMGFSPALNPFFQYGPMMQYSPNNPFQPALNNWTPFNYAPYNPFVSPIVGASGYPFGFSPAWGNNPALPGAPGIGGGLGGLGGAAAQPQLSDPKPDAPAESRGDFRPIATAVPGLSICEHLPRLARVIDRCTVIRSMSHPYNIHSAAYTMTGVERVDIPMELN